MDLMEIVVNPCDACGVYAAEVGTDPVDLNLCDECLKKEAA